jgi:hypothetical protein
MNRQQFNEKFKEYLEEGSPGMQIDFPSVNHFVATWFNDLIKFPGFKFYSIETQYGLAKVINNLEELIPFAGRQVNLEMEDKINFILKVEYEIIERLKSINLDANGNPL